MTKARVNADNASADIQGVTAGTGLSGGGTSGTVTLTNDMATTIDAKGDLVVGTGADTYSRLATGNNGETLVADSSTSTGLRWQSNFSVGRNKLINADFRFNQRNFTSNTTSGTYNFDRWLQSNTGGTNTVTPQVFTPGSAPVAGYEGSNFLRATTASQTGTTFATVEQRIESVRTFAGETVTVSFWAKAASGTPKIAVELGQNFGSGGSPSAQVFTNNGNVTISTSWARYSITINCPSISGKTIGTTNDGFLQVRLWLSASSDWNPNTGSMGTQNNTFDIWGVQIESGNVATPFTTATGTLAGELCAAQRYYFRFTGPSVYSTYGQGYYESTTGGNIDMPFPVTMRTQPSSIDFANVAVQDSGGGVAGITAMTINQSSLKGASLNFTVASGGTAHRPLRFLNNNNANGYIGLNAEL